MADRRERRERFERRAMQEERLEKSLSNLVDAASDLDNETDLDAIADGLEAVEKELGRAKMHTERLIADDR